MSKASISLIVSEGDIASRPCDLLILKHADDFYGVDEFIAKKIGFSKSLAPGEHVITPGKRIEAKQVLFVGVGPLADFRYGNIRSYGQTALQIAKEVGIRVHKICTPVHGPGYGLDENEAFLSLIAGFTDAVDHGDIPSQLAEIEIVERNPARADRLKSLLQNTLAGSLSTRASQPSTSLGLEKPVKSSIFTINPSLQHNELASYGAKSESKTCLFVAMPFKDDFIDEWEISITEAALASDLICERIDQQSYTGDVLVEIKNRIRRYDGLIALLNGANANVFLEIGFAWASEKPTILLAKQGQDLPFDIRGQKCIFYSGIADLRKKLSHELTQLKAAELFSRPRGT